MRTPLPCLPALLLLGACTAPLAQDPGPSAASVAEQIAAHDAAAQQLADGLQRALQPGLTRQDLQALPVSAATREALLSLREAAAERFPVLLKEPSWIAESSQLVSAEDAARVTPNLTTLYVIATARPGHPDQLAWVATVTADTRTGNILDTHLADTLDQTYTPAFLQAADPDGHINPIRRVLEPAVSAQAARQAPALLQTRVASFKTPHEALPTARPTPEQSFITKLAASAEAQQARALGVDGVIAQGERTTLLVHRAALGAQSLQSLALQAQSAIRAQASNPASVLHGLGTDVQVQATPLNLDELHRVAGQVVTLLGKRHLAATLNAQHGRLHVGYSGDRAALEQALKAAGVDLGVVEFYPLSANLMFSFGGGGAAPPPTPQNLRTQVSPLAGGAQFSQLGNRFLCSLGYAGVVNGQPGFATARHCFQDVFTPSTTVYHPTDAKPSIGYYAAYKFSGADSAFLALTNTNYQAYVAVADVTTGNVTGRLQQVYRPSEVTISSDVRLSGRTTYARQWRYNLDFFNRTPLYVSQYASGSNWQLNATLQCLAFRKQTFVTGGPRLNDGPTGGDSGGTVFTGTSQANLLGTLTGAINLDENPSGYIGVCYTTVDDHWAANGVSPYAY